MNKLTTIEINSTHHQVLLENEPIGYAIQDIDGYFYFNPTVVEVNIWSSKTLKMISHLLNLMDKKWDYDIQQYFNNRNKN